MVYKVEYIWLDGYKPEPNLRSKTKIIHTDKKSLFITDIPNWNFDGSSTKQASGDKSDCVLKPVKLIKDPLRENGYLVMCEVMNSDGTSHESNTRHLIENDDNQYWFGMEQEYTLMKNQRPYGFPENGYPAPQGEYYCGVGYGKVAGREIVEEHLNACLEAKLNITGINHEVLLGQSEYQILSRGAKTAGDDLWLSRYLLYRITENYKLKVSFHPKPVEGDFNGSGCHFNFSNDYMRQIGGEEYINEVCDMFSTNHKETMKVYGSSNDKRLTGDYETQNINTFSYGVSDRGASIRIPITVPEDGWVGYLEDRRPASNCDPYKVTRVITENISKVKTEKTNFTDININVEF